MTDIWYALQDHQRYVYHYTGPLKLEKYILPFRRLLFSRFADVNDPRESKEWTFSFSSYGDDLDLSADAIRSIFDDELRQAWRLGCFTVDDPKASIHHPKFSATESLWLRGHSRPRMWSQYGDNYQGACLVFDLMQLDAAIKTAAGHATTVHSGHVLYETDPFAGRSLSRDNPHLIDSNEVRSFGPVKAAALHVARHYERLYFRKALDWSAEQEFRWAVSSTTFADLFVDIKDSLVGILLGDRSPNELRKKVGEYANMWPISVAIMDWRNNGVPQPLPIHAHLLLSTAKA